jgi:hypothetical protein
MARRPTKVSRRIRVSERIIDGSFLIPRRETAYRELARIPLDVNFQEVVHSIRTGNADVAKPQ